MSYFMIAVGQKPDFSSISNVEALPIQEAQEYLRRLVPVLIPNEPETAVWFIHDGETGTSHNFIQESIEQMQMEDVPFDSTILAKIIKRCDRARNAFKVWWAGAELELEGCASIEVLKDTIVKQVMTGGDIRVSYEPPNCGPTSGSRRA